MRLQRRKKNMADTLLVEKSDYICTVTINRPEKHNALNPDVLRSIRDTFRSFEIGGDVRVVVLRGAGEKAFCAGADVGSTVFEESNLQEEAMQSIIICPVPVIAMIYGYAIGAGCYLAAVCDMRVAAGSARMGFTPVRFGFLPPLPALQCFIDLYGLAYTEEIFLTGEFFTAERAREMGMLNYVVPAGELSSTTCSIAQKIAEKAPLSVSGIKTLIRKIIAREPDLPQSFSFQSKYKPRSYSNFN